MIIYLAVLKTLLSFRYLFSLYFTVTLKLSCFVAVIVFSSMQFMKKNRLNRPENGERTPQLPVVDALVIDKADWL